MDHLPHRDGSFFGLSSPGIGFFVRAEAVPNSSTGSTGRHGVTTDCCHLRQRPRNLSVPRDSAIQSSGSTPKESQSPRARLVDSRPPFRVLSRAFCVGPVHIRLGPRAASVCDRGRTGVVTGSRRGGQSKGSGIRALAATGPWRGQAPKRKSRLTRSPKVLQLGLRLPTPVRWSRVDHCVIMVFSPSVISNAMHQLNF